MSDYIRLTIFQNLLGEFVQHLAKVFDVIHADFIYFNLKGACVAGLVDSPVTIKNIEYAIVDRAWDEGWITPRIPKYRTGQSVSVIGSGPAGLAAADCLNQLGHKVLISSHILSAMLYKM